MNYFLFSNDSTDHQSMERDTYMKCPNQGCRNGKVHCLVGWDFFWNDCPVCGGLGSVKRGFSDTIMEYHSPSQ